MTILLLRDASVALEDDNGVLVDISPGVAGGRLDAGEPMTEYFTLDSPWAKTVAVGRRGRLTLDLLAETGAGSAHGLLRGWLRQGGARTARITQTVGDEALMYSGRFRLAALRALARAQSAGGEPARLTAYLVLDGALNLTP